VTGWLPEEQVFGDMASSDVGLDTSLQAEVSPVKAMEYMASGLPLVSFDLPETRSIAEDAAVLVAPVTFVPVAVVTPGDVDQ
jgi:glycosyltransferase involved in cell wall biosynthesis